MTSRQMVLGMQFSGGRGAAPGAWRLPGANLNSYTDMDQFARYAQAAERGKVQLLFIADPPVLDVDLDHHAPHHMIDPLLLLTPSSRARPSGSAWSPPPPPPSPSPTISPASSRPWR
ncbi:hypothetical protein [Streptomyces plumbiresistens]|uniref:Uncharacterized protein n=1 Tax=Streptomyces plumbiresistens TaxID=511811 RepID=A0ABP7TWT1_9ACTN